LAWERAVWEKRPKVDYSVLAVFIRYIELPFQFEIYKIVDAQTCQTLYEWNAEVTARSCCAFQIPRPEFPTVFAVFDLTEYLATTPTESFTHLRKQKVKSAIGKVKLVEFTSGDAANEQTMQTMALTVGNGTNWDANDLVQIAKKRLEMSQEMVREALRKSKHHMT
jgi:hypothetical protein